MPVILSENISPDAGFAIWEIIENESDLFQGIRLSPQDKETILSLRLEKRRLERIACRKTLAFLLNVDCVPITYGVSGEPLSPAGNISFSHSAGFAAAALSSTHKIGIDIEKITPKIVKLHHKFISPKELETIDAHNPEDVTRIWCAKEAVYKLFPGNSIDFIEQIEIHSPFAARLKLDEKMISIDLHTKKVKDLMGVIATSLKTH
ncbi:4'-phosphopantetheinyl transferase superfamily protein [Bacteroidales bacterium OttesenSCG-928-B11]|nr:4'-phosphopantetheinyl transferase superfamily protein [Bacteroidales bacterium OttesenSCG-928-C03]MDL2311847.1 4'-phosphopantetheinyl transferase superfamily protein [Bacteroidales bacterium OttesenSCG-928-B11]MDL2325504.1 4'-phosphopantetheinyl transferase superfamily protein [Bacteroidales bacterium OttesenSCG-928-A14]